MANVVLTYAFLSFLFLFVFTTNNVNGQQYGIMLAQSPDDSEQFCILYYKEFTDLPHTKNGEIFVPLVDESHLSFCAPEKPSTKDLRNKFVLIDAYNCSLNEKAVQAKSLGCQGIIIVSNNRNDEAQYRFNVSGVDDSMNITVALIAGSSAQRLSEMGQDVTVLLYSLEGYGFDFSFIIIFAIAVGTITIGAYWSGLVRHSLHNLEVKKLSESTTARVTDGSREEKPDSQPVVEESTLNISPLYIAVIVMCMISMLLLLYFFFGYLVYVIIGLFVLASIIAVFACLDALLSCFNCSCGPFQSWQQNNNNNGRLCCKESCWQRCRCLFIFSCAVTLAVVWVVYRNASFSWVLQDILGVAFIINMLKSVRLPSFKICTYLLVLLFFYDIFFVFITPYLTKKGDSVMVEVATGGNSKEQTGKASLFENVDGSPNEQLPMVLRVPHLRFDPWAVCYQEYSMLGFGDILVPGLLVSYCHGIDMYLKNRKVYYITTLIAYGIGLLVTFGGLYLMSMPQPALLYLVPATLLPPLILAKLRNELTLLWDGVRVAKPETTTVRELGTNGDISRELEGGEATIESIPTPQNPMDLPIEEISVKQKEENLVSEGNGERKFLLQNEAIK